jgi:hypothetical protein
MNILRLNMANKNPIEQPVENRLARLKENMTIFIYKSKYRRIF